MKNMTKKVELSDLIANYSVTIIMEDGEERHLVTNKQMLKEIIQLALFEEHKIKEMHYFNLKLKKNEIQK